MDDLSEKDVNGDAEEVIDLTIFDEVTPEFREHSENPNLDKTNSLGMSLAREQAKVATRPQVINFPPHVTPSLEEEFYLQKKPFSNKRADDKRREYISLLMAVLLIAMIGYVVYRATQASQSQVTVSASSGEQVVLNFQSTAVISSISVRPGQYVTKGQLLATQDASSVSAKVSADKANIESDQSALAALQQQVSQPSAVQLATINNDKATIAQLQGELNDTISSENQIITTAANEYNSLLQVEQNDESSYSNICPNGLATQNNQAGSNTCSSLYDQIDSDKRALSAAAGDVNTAEANAVVARDQVQSRLNQATNQLAQDQAQITTSESSTNSIDQLNSKITADKNALSQDLQLVGQTDLRAPISGVIEEINGYVGELAGPSGTANSSQSGVATSANNAQSLFQSVDKGQTVANSPAVPLIIIDDRSSWNVRLLVPQNRLGEYSPGKTIKTVFQVPFKKTFNGVVSSASPVQVIENGSSFFQVTLNESGPMPIGLYQGQIGTLG